jgi:hypothetical protein
MDASPLARVSIARQQEDETLEDIKDRIQNFTFRICLGPPTGFSSGHQMLNQGPLAVTQIGRVWFTRFHAPMLSEVIGPRQSY